MDKGEAQLGLINQAIAERRKKEAWLKEQQANFRQLYVPGKGE